jgi:Tfp pilus assembly protein PilE
MVKYPDSYVATSNVARARSDLSQNNKYVERLSTKQNSLFILVSSRSSG